MFHTSNLNLSPNLTLMCVCHPYNTCTHYLICGDMEYCLFNANCCSMVWKNEPRRSPLSKPPISASGADMDSANDFLVANAFLLLCESELEIFFTKLQQDA